MAYLKLDDVNQAIVTYLTTNIASVTGLNAVAYGDKKLTPTFPVALVVPERLHRDLHATGNLFLLTFFINIYLVTAKLSQSEANRQKVDLQMSEQVVALMDANKTLSGNIVFGYVSDVQHGILGRTVGNDVLIGSRLEWRGTQRG